jgi:hypothetical protein
LEKGDLYVTDNLLAEIATAWTRIGFVSAVNKHEGN